MWQVLVLVATYGMSAFPGSVRAIPYPTKPCQTSGLIACLSNSSVPFKLPCDSDWATYSTTYNVRLPVTPAAIVIPHGDKSVDHVQNAVKCAGSNGVKVQAKSGGHSYASYSSGGVDGQLVVDLRNFNTTSVQDGGKDAVIATVGGGVRLGNLANDIYKQDKRAMAHGDCPGVGIGGHFTHGGYGFSSRAWGLALDQIVGMQVILANGTEITADSTTNSEIYWAMRGGADSIGIAITFFLKTQPAPPAVVNWNYEFQSIANDVEKSVAAFKAIQNWVGNSSAVDRKLGFGLALGPSSPSSLNFVVSGTYMGSKSDFLRNIEPEMLRNLPQWTARQIDQYDWPTSLSKLNDLDSLTPPDPYTLRSNFFAKSVAVPEPGMTDEALKSYFEYIINGPKPPTNYFILVDLWGGADSQINTKDLNFAAVPLRNNLWVAQHYAYVENDETFPDEGINYLNGLNEAMVKALPRWNMYLNYVDPTLSRNLAHTEYYGEPTLSRLQSIKAQVDPNNVFSNPQSF